MFRRRLLAVALLAGVATPLMGQAGDTIRPGVGPSPAPHRQVVSVSPLFAIFGFLSGEFERRITSSATAAIGASAFELGPFGYRSVDVKARFYPGEQALAGLAVAVSAGRIWLSADAGGVFSGPASGSGFVLGSEVSYTWLTGTRRNVALGLGAGAKRILRYGGYDVSAAQVTYPTARASLGLAF